MKHKFDFTWLVLLLVALGLQACATDPNASAVDPYESSNRRVFAFNEGVDSAVLKPAAQAYDTVIPNPVQDAVGNFVNNIKDVWSFANLILQGEGAAAGHEFMRVGTNTTLGMLGFVDVASSAGLDRHGEDLGQTLAVWGAPDGAYLMLPFFGPSTTRDTLTLPADQYPSLTVLFEQPRDVNAARATQLLNTRARLLQATDLLEDAALDKYAFVRDAYLQRRRNQIYNGDPPDIDQNDEGEPEPQAVAPTSNPGNHRAFFVTEQADPATDAVVESLTQVLAGTTCCLPDSELAR